MPALRPHFPSVLPQGNKNHRSKSPCNVALPATSPGNDSQAAATKFHDGPPPPKKRLAATTVDDSGSSKPKKGQTGVQDGSTEGKKKGKSYYPSEVIQCIPGGAATKIHSISQRANNSHKKCPLTYAASVSPQDSSTPSISRKARAIDNPCPISARFFHFVLHYSNVIMKLYDIYFDLDVKRVCLSPSKIKNNNEVPVKSNPSDTDNQPESNTLLPLDDVGKPPENKGNKSDEGNMDNNRKNESTTNDKDANSGNNGALKPAAKKKTEKNGGRKQFYRIWK
eukprot:jgi/Psemu1/21465/gm1.21465_g